MHSLRKVNDVKEMSCCFIYKPIEHYHTNEKGNSSSLLANANCQDKLALRSSNDRSAAVSDRQLAGHDREILVLFLKHKPANYRVAN